MFGKQIMEVCTIIIYWVLCIPLTRWWFGIEIGDKPFEFIFAQPDLLLYMILGYLVVYRIACYIFIILKSFDLGLWHNLTKTKVSLDMQLKEAKKAYDKIDVVDGPQNSRTNGPPAILSNQFSTLPDKNPKRAPLPPKSKLPPTTSLDRLDKIV